MNGVSDGQSSETTRRADVQSAAAKTILREGIDVLRFFFLSERFKRLLQRLTFLPTLI